MSEKRNTCLPDFVMPFGKYKGKTLSEISEADPSYIVWLSDNNVLSIESEFLETCLTDISLEEALMDFRHGDYGCRDAS